MEEEANETRDGDITTTHLTPDEAFSLIGHDTRFAILRALNDAAEPLSFNELHSRVDIDDSGRFNYHLQKLTGRFVRSDEEGYQLAVPGQRVIGAVLSGVYTQQLDADPVTLDGTCLDCGGTLRTYFRMDQVQILCDDCGLNVGGAEVPPGVLESWPREEIGTVIDHWLKRELMSTQYGLCYNCDGRLEPRLYLPPDEAAPEWLTEVPLPATAHYECQRCGNNWFGMVGMALLMHPAVVAFHHDHGIDLQETPVWDLPWAETNLETVASQNPVRLEVPYRIGDETLVLTVDRSLTVIGKRRE